MVSMTLGQVVYRNSCDLQIPPQSETNLKVIEPFGELLKEKGTAPASQRSWV